MSGLTALVYEVVWSKYLALIFGSTVEAQTVVLAVFMGGLALGSRWMGSWTMATRHPVVSYGFIEIALGVYGFFFDWIQEGLNGLFVAWGTPLLEHDFALLGLKTLLSVVMLLPPTVFMGGTLPLLATWLQRERRDTENGSSGWVARFYAINSLGAVIGSGLAGFWIVRALGLPMTLWFTALINVMVGCAAIMINRREKLRHAMQAGGGMESEACKSKSAKRIGLSQACWIVALTGGVSMGLEVLASRMLSLVFGASLQAFSVVLMAFILGISLGGWVASSRRIQPSQVPGITMALLLGASCVLVAWVWGIEEWVVLYRWLGSGVARSEVGYMYHVLMTALLAMACLGIPAALLGAVLPLWMRTIQGENMGRAVGRLMMWNTVGAVVGVLFTGFFLMPWAGLRGAFGSMAVILSLAGFALAGSRHRKKTITAYAALFMLLAWALSEKNETWQKVMSSGVFRARGTNVHPRLELMARQRHIHLLYYQDAPDATVSVEMGDGLAASCEISLRINGKPDASTEGDLSTQFLLAHLPMAVRPESKDIFVLGFGSGITAGALLGHPIHSLTIAENCEPVLKAALYFEKWNRDVLHHPKTRIWHEDARTVLKLSPKLYDVIISEPSNPWMAGVGGVFSHQFYELAASRLKEGGVMAQWFHVYETNDAILALVLRTFQKTFPHVEIWDTLSGDMVLLGSRKDFASDPSVYRKIYERSLVAADLARIGVTSPETLWARQLASQSTTPGLAGNGPWQSDDQPILEYDAPHAFYIGAKSALPSMWDERIRQSGRASPLKRETLGRLSPETLKIIFGRYQSVNPELMKKISDGALAGQSKHTPPTEDIPCLFKAKPKFKSR